MQALIKPDACRLQLISQTCGGGKLDLPHVENIYLISVWIAGTRYYDAQSAVPGLVEGAPIQLRREPANAHDKLAIEVWSETVHKLGHVPREHNRVLARLMDAGKCVHAKLARVDLSSDVIELRCGQVPCGRADNETSHRTHGAPEIRIRIYMQNL